jgi:agmatinase
MIRFLGKENSVSKIEKASTVIIPVPLEYSTSYGKGTARGPDAILNASPYLELYDEELDFEVWKTGVLTTPTIDLNDNPAQCLSKINEVVASYINEDKFVVILGGEHSLTSAVHEAFYDRHPDLSVLQLDAHSDLRDTYEGSKYSHACVMRRIWEKNKSIVEVGIRSQCKEEKEFILHNQIPIYYAHDLYGKNFPLKIMDTLNEDVFITIDTDFFDPAIMPAVGTPEPGGFFWYETLSFLRQVFEQKNVVGMDIVEFNPVKNLTHPDFFMAKFIYKLIGYKINGKRK